MQYILGNKNYFFKSTSTQLALKFESPQICMKIRRASRRACLSLPHLSVSSFSLCILLRMIQLVNLPWISQPTQMVPNSWAQMMQSKPTLIQGVNKQLQRKKFQIWKTSEILTFLFETYFNSHKIFKEHIIYMWKV